MKTLHKAAGVCNGKVILMKLTFLFYESVKMRIGCLRAYYKVGEKTEMRLKQTER